MHPESGARFVLDLAEETEGHVAYRVEVFGPTDQWGATATVALASGEVAFAEWSPSDPPDWTAKLARAFLRAAWSTSCKPDRPAWPRRIVRWRAAKGG